MMRTLHSPDSQKPEKSVHVQINEAVEKLHVLCTGVRKVASGWNVICFEADKKKAEKDPAKLVQKIIDILISSPTFYDSIKKQEIISIEIKYVSRTQLESYFLRQSLHLRDS